MVVCLVFFFKQKTAYELLRSLVGSEMWIRDSIWPEFAPDHFFGCKQISYLDVELLSLLFGNKINLLLSCFSNRDLVPSPQEFHIYNVLAVSYTHLTLPTNYSV